jgi:hypothetical protein
MFLAQAQLQVRSIRAGNTKCILEKKIRRKQATGSKANFRIAFYGLEGACTLAVPTGKTESQPFTCKNPIVSLGNVDRLSPALAPAAHTIEPIPTIEPPSQSANPRNSISESHTPNVATPPAPRPDALCFQTTSRRHTLPPIVNFQKNAYPPPHPILQCICN